MAAAKNGWATQKRKAGERATPFGAVPTCLFFSMSAGKNPNPPEQISTALTWCHDQRQRGPLWKSSVALVKCLPLVEDSDSSHLATRREWGCLYLPPWSTSSHDRVMTECSTLVMCRFESSQRRNPHKEMELQSPLGSSAGNGAWD